MKEIKDVLSNMVDEDSKLKLKIKKEFVESKIPTRGTPDSAGLDLYAIKSYEILPHTNINIHTGVSMEIPENHVGLLFIRSSLASKSLLRPSNCVGVIDSDYRGEVILSLYNDNMPLNWLQKLCNKIKRIKTDPTIKYIHEGDRVGQLVILPYINPKIIECDNLSDTSRNTGGFGSTGR